MCTHTVVRRCVCARVSVPSINKLTQASAAESSSDEHTKTQPSAQSTTPSEKPKPQQSHLDVAKTPTRRPGSGRISVGGDESPRNFRGSLRATQAAPTRKRLIHCKGKKRIHVREVEVSADSLNNKDV